jgi:PAS domain S-box-containing protein
VDPVTTSQRVFQRQIRRLILVPLALLLLIAALLEFQVRRLTAAQDWVDHSDVVLSQARLLLRFMIDQETGLRGFLLTHDQRFLDPYHAADPALDRLFDQLAASVADNPLQQQRLIAIRQGYDQWHSWAEKAISHFRRNDPELASVPFNLAGKQMMDDLRAGQQAFAEQEEQIKRSREQTSKDANRTLTWSLLGLVIVFGAVLFYETRSSVRAVDAEYATILHNLQTRSTELSESRERLQVTLRSIGDAVIVTDANGNVTFLNPVAEKLTQYSQERAHGKPLEQVFRIVSEETRQTVENPFTKVMRLGTIVGLANHTALLREDGSEISIDDSGAPIRAENGDIFGVVLVFRDVTEQKALLNVLQMNEKLAAAGKLSASIAHEIHNPLETVSNLLFLIRKQSGSNVAQLIAMADQEISRVVQITKNMLSLYRESKHVIPTRLSEVVDSVLVILQRSLRDKRIAISRHILTESSISAFPAEMRQVVSNLLANAIDAVEPGGQIDICVENARFKDSQPAVALIVRDNGCGISKENTDKLFRPFFTTKGQNGTGLGLWITHGIVSKVGGYIEVESETAAENHGTTFKVVFPRLAPEEHSAA